jgi:phosphoribosylformimino-5-aminoimidazole carboxamide ribotide isomerase
LKIIPVLDILNGVAVHAVRGERKNYKPLKSVVCASADPIDVAMAFKRLGFAELYLADLDAISRNQPNLAIVNETAKTTGLRLMVDGGVTDLERAEKLLANRVSKVVVGTETLRDINFVSEAVHSFGSSRIVVSLDLKNGRLLYESDFGKFPEPLDLLREFQKMGVKQVIVLDLARVGSGEGVDVLFLKKVLDELELEVFVGGGARDINDLLELNNLRVSGVLLATALHSGSITVDELKRAGLSLE